MTAVVAGRLQDREKQLLDQWARDHGKTPAQVVREAILAYIGASELGEYGRRESGEGRDPTDAGAGARRPPDWTATPPATKTATPPLGLASFSAAEIQELLIHAWGAARVAEKAEDPVAVLREALRSPLERLKRPNLTDPELNRILQELADGSERDHRKGSPTIKKILEARHA